jgi:ATP-dependent exoDNAse (exonuclease V) beta subunit
MTTPATASILDELNGPQKEIAATLNVPVFVEAGAGSGKTFTLVRRVIWAMTPGSAGPAAPGEAYLDSLDQALIITYTKEAANEIKERIRKALLAAGLHKEALAAEDAWVSTIHGMCSRILHAEALTLGIDPSFEMIDDAQAKDLLNQAINEEVRQAQDSEAARALFSYYPAQSSGGAGGWGNTNSVTSLLSQVFAAASTCTHGLEDLHLPAARANLMQLAHDAQLRYSELITAVESGNKPSEKRVAHLEKLIASRDALAAFCNAAPGEHTVERLAATVEQVVRPDGNILGKLLKEPRVAAAQSFAILQQELRQELIHEAGEALLALARKVDARYAAFKRERGVLDNDDLLRLTHQAFLERPEIAARYQHKFKLVMIDEFQDTNQQQVEMINLIAGDAPVCTVGDAQQSIYKFRGADVNVFRSTQAQVDTVIQMDTNFRSHHEVLRAVAAVCNAPAAAEPLVPHFMDLTAGRSEAALARPLAAGVPRVYIEAVHAPYQGFKAELQRPTEAALIARRLKTLMEQDPALEPGRMAVLMRSLSHVGEYQDALAALGIPSVVTGGSTFSTAPEVQLVAQLLVTLANPANTQDGLYPVLSSDLFGLTCADLLLVATREQEPPASEAAGDTEKCHEVASVAAGTEAGSAAASAATRLPTKRKLDRGMEAFTFIEGVTPSPELLRAKEVLDAARQALRTRPVAAVVEQVFYQAGWFSRQEEAGMAGEARMANVLRAIAYLKDLTTCQQMGPAKAAQEFAAWLEATKAGPAALAVGEANAVRMMTIHASKGLEFDVVAVVSAFDEPRKDTGLLTVRTEAGLMLTMPLPTDDVLKKLGTFNKKDLPQEERPSEAAECVTAAEWRMLAEDTEAQATAQEQGRLAYVALTRAREVLVVGVCAKVSKKGPTPAATAAFEEALGATFEPGTSTFAYGGEMAGVLEMAQGVADGTVLEALATTGDERYLDAFAQLYGAVDARKVDEAAAEGEELEGELELELTPEPTPEPAPFTLYTAEQEQSTRTTPKGREGVYSYSQVSALEEGKLMQCLHAAEAAAGDAACKATAQVAEVPSSTVPAGAQQEDLLVQAGGEGAPVLAAANLSQVLAQDQEAEEPFDGDRATALGEAFHVLAQIYADTNELPGEERVRRECRRVGVSPAGRKRIQAALELWAGSELRREVWAAGPRKSEFPFFVEALSRYGEWLNGAIDLLVEPADGGALVVDYKTGEQDLTPAAARVTHELQANYYAWVLMQAGYPHVTCHFVEVECPVPSASDATTLAPRVITYEFDEGHLPSLTPLT